MQPPIEWQFLEDSDGSPRWRWRRAFPDGTASESPDFADYAAAVTDAIKTGFEPDRESYSVTSARGTTIHAPSADDCRPLRGPIDVLRSSRRRFVLSDAARRQFRKCLDAAIAAQRAEKGNIQLVDRTGVLEIVLQRGFRQTFLKHFEHVQINDDSACGRAYRAASPVLIADVHRDQRFARYRAVAASAGFRAVQSMPLTDHAGSVIGMLSVHYAEPLPFPEWRLTRLIESAQTVCSTLQKHDVRPAAIRVT